MKVDRKKFITHLRKVWVDGYIPEAVFEGTFRMTALDEYQTVAVFAPGIPGTEELPQPLGIGDLGLLIKTLGVNPGEGNESTYVEVSSERDEIGTERWVVDEGYRGATKLMTAHPSTIVTRVADDTVEKLSGKIPTEGGVPLPWQVVEGVLRLASLLKVQEVSLHLGPEGGRVRLGNLLGHYWEVEFPSLVWEVEHEVVLGPEFISVLKVISPRAELFPSGPNKLVGIRDEEYVYLLSPRARPAGSGKM